jgi:hypothetical protein
MEPENNHSHLKGQASSPSLLDQEMHKKHTDELGLNVPEDYFYQSKKEILEKIPASKNGKLVLLTRNKAIWLAAASLAFVLVLNLFKTNVKSDFDKIPAVVLDTIEKLKDNNLVNEFFETEEKDILISSLFIEDAELDEFIADYVIEGALDEEIPH